VLDEIYLAAEKNEEKSLKISNGCRFRRLARVGPFATIFSRSHVGRKVKFYLQNTM
jgi:hypothetical protein